MGDVRTCVTSPHHSRGMTSFKALGLSEQMVRAVVAAGYTTPTPIQAAAIPVALEGKDLIGCAQTGTGKTAAFVLPMLERLSASPHGRTGRPIRALVVTPTRELALQVEESVQTYGKFTGLRITAVFGGVGMQPQLQAFRRGIDIVIATPGRLLDHLSRRSLDLSAVEYLVLDEADRMFDMGFINDVRKIVAAVAKQRQTLLFSATMPPPIQALAASIQQRPVMVEVGQRTNPAESVQQHFYSVSQQMKLDLLLHVLDTEPVSSVLVFSRTKHRADRITKRLSQRGFSAAAIHSNRTQNQRQRALDGFKRGDYQVLVGTDVAARGIDVDGISHVINFDTPNQAEDYIHRIGRTGRAEATGEAITFVSADEVAYLREIERFTGKRVERGDYPGFTPTRESGDGRGSDVPQMTVAPRTSSGRPHRHQKPGTGGSRRNSQKQSRNRSRR
jgi:ATP-dependent RNA helicase RhlE